MSNFSSQRKSFKNSASSDSDSGVIPIFSYTLQCSKQCTVRCSTAPLVQVARPSAPASSCRVLSSHKRAISPPLSDFIYDYTQKAYSNREGYTWTPMYLQHCPKLYAFTEIKNQDRNHVKPREILASFSVAFRNASKYSWACGRPHQGGNFRQLTTYSKFMESPYINRLKTVCYVSEVLDET